MLPAWTIFALNWSMQDKSFTFTEKLIVSVKNKNQHGCRYKLPFLPIWDVEMISKQEKNYSAETSTTSAAGSRCRETCMVINGSSPLKHRLDVLSWQQTVWKHSNSSGSKLHKRGHLAKKKKNNKILNIVMALSTLPELHLIILYLTFFLSNSPKSFFQGLMLVHIDFLSIYDKGHLFT